MTLHTALTTYYFEYKMPSNLRRIQFLNGDFKKELHRRIYFDAFI
jgi:hypothetical protein